MIRRWRIVSYLALVLTVSAVLFVAGSNDSVSASSGPWSFYGTPEHTWSSGNWKFRQSWTYRHHTTSSLEMQKATIKATNLAGSTVSGSGSFEIYYGNTDLDFFNFIQSYNASQTIWTDYTRNKVYNKDPYGGVLSITKSCGCGPPPQNIWEIQTNSGTTTITNWHN